MSREVATIALSINPIARSYRFFRRWPVIPLLVVVALAMVAIFAPLIVPYDPLYGNLEHVVDPPAWVEGGSGKHLLGADHIGRDILSRMVFGARISLMVAATVLLAGCLLGTIAGITSGYVGGVVDESIMRLVDFTYAVPFIMVALVAAVVFGSSLGLIIILLAIFSWAPFARLVRAEALRLKTMDYVSLAKVAGASPLRISYRHVLPGVMSTVLVLATLRVGLLILTESVLSFLGVGIPAPTPSWGNMVADGRDYVEAAWWISLFPGLAIFVTVFAFNFLGDWLRDWLDPRLRQI
jgi:peptide/nickel transport system permease protein